MVLETFWELKLVLQGCANVDLRSDPINKKSSSSFFFLSEVFENADAWTIRKEDIIAVSNAEVECVISIATCSSISNR